MKIIGVIPSRYKSSRFPGKPLADICGKPLVWWVYQQAVKVKCLDQVLVATDDERIFAVCSGFRIPVIMTSPDHQNGSERLSEVANKTDGDIYVTIQGDEPLLEPTNIERVVSTLLNDPSVDCATLKTPFTNPVDVINGTTPKVVCDLNNHVLLFTRSPVPYPKASLNYRIYKPLGAYAFKRDLLIQYKNLAMGPLEQAEEIELLRLLEHGFPIAISEVLSDSIAVDTPKDLDRVISMFKERGF